MRQTGEGKSEVKRRRQRQRQKIIIHFFLGCSNLWVECSVDTLSTVSLYSDEQSLDGFTCVSVPFKIILEMEWLWRLKWWSSYGCRLWIFGPRNNLNLEAYKLILVPIRHINICSWNTVKVKKIVFEETKNQCYLFKFLNRDKPDIRVHIRIISEHPYWSNRRVWKTLFPLHNPVALYFHCITQ